MKDLNKDSGQEIPDLRDAAIFTGISSAANIAETKVKICEFSDINLNEILYKNELYLIHEMVRNTLFFHIPHSLPP